MIEKMTNNVWIPSDLSKLIQDDAFRRRTAVRKGHSPAPLQTLILIPSVRGGGQTNPLRVSANVINQIGNAITRIGVHEHRTGDTTVDRCRPKAEVRREMAYDCSAAGCGHSVLGRERPQWATYAFRLHSFMRG
ncbi:hypothetical protein ACEPT7_00655 [Burkholderia ubonensis]|uniref:hypothetical protein n=1 Tax=Burkholderia ubonensis TaxID=101571 RepID=UPI00358F8891